MQTVIAAEEPCYHHGLELLDSGLSDWIATGGMSRLLDNTMLDWLLGCYCRVMQILVATEEHCSDLDSNSGAAGHPGAEIISGSVWISHSYMQRMEEREK